MSKDTKDYVGGEWKFVPDNQLWYAWLKSDLEAVLNIEGSHAGPILQVTLRGITSWGCALYGQDIQAEKRFVAVCVDHLKLERQYANALYACKRGYETAGTWPYEIAVSTPYPKNKPIFGAIGISRSILHINAKSLAEKLLEALAKHQTELSGSGYKYAVSAEANDIVEQAVERILELEGRTTEKE